MRQLTLPIGRTRPPAFDTFVAGPNVLAVAQLLELAAHPAAAALPLPAVYLWGPAGCGKSHLLGALAGRWQARGAEVGFFDPQTPLPWPLDERRELVVLDDCDGFDADRQQAAFALFVDAVARGALVAAAGRLPPVDLPLRDDLRSRLGWGDVLALQPLGEADVKTVLDNEARRRGLQLPADVGAYVLSHFARDLKSLMTLLDRADEFALSQQRALTIPLIRQMLQEQQAAGVADR
ncbi:HdaA/DnaA family protein [Piscinibacter sakaiensis]|uniref:HdaA/DnaA family protein n=1 Tax=Piscinibacter sakaiensis TaxID=1547922 RepID=UPI003AAB12F5